MATEIRKIGEQCPYRVGGRRHATLHPDVTFRHEDHSTCPADSRPGPRPHHHPSRSSPAIQQSTDPTRGVSGWFPSRLCGPSLRLVQKVVQSLRPEPMESLQFAELWLGSTQLQPR
jgi:hypothetical protein